MKRFWLAVVLVGGGLLPSPIGAQQPQVSPYRILVSNDDGVRAPGIAAIAQVLQAIGEVTIVAPADNQSGKGHSITIADPIVREDLNLPNGLKAIGLTATPVTTMKVALANIVRPRPDLVVTGINSGLNAGLDSYLSGTVGGAREAAMQGIPAIAASLAAAGAPRDYMAAAEEVSGVARRVKQFGLPRNVFLSVNLPARPASGYRGYLVTSPAMVPGGAEAFPETTHPGSGRVIYWNTYKEGATAPEGTDIWALAQGYVSVTPMRVGEGDQTQVDRIRQWFK